MRVFRDREESVKDLTDKVVVVTGGTKGLGRLLAARFAQEGAKVVVWARTQADLEVMVDECCGKGWQAFGYSVDVSDYDTVVAAARRVKKEVGVVDVLVNNAGVVHGGPFLEVSAEQHRQTVDVNFSAFMWTMKAFMPDMVERNSGHVINLSSAAGLSYAPLMASYCGSKAAVVNFTDSVRLELKCMKKDGVKLTIVCPAFIETGMFEGVKVPIWLPWLKPQELADKIFDGYQRDAEMVAEPFFPKIAPLFRAAHSRRQLDRLLTIFGLSKAMEDWRGHNTR
jgi:all-trans-retinol dehydrogenase (NAD+)